MSEHQHHAGTQVGSDGLLVHGGLLLVVDQNHDHVGLLGGLRCGIYLKSLLLRLLPGTASLVQANDHVAAGFLKVQRVGVALAAVTDDGNGLALQQ